MMRYTLIFWALVQLPFCLAADSINSTKAKLEIRNISNTTQNSQYENKTNNNTLEKIVEKIETVLGSDPAIPKLTRGEVLDIIENITESDPKEGQKARKIGDRNEKAVMLVMPYTPDGTSDNMQDLYTKPPVTHIVGDSPQNITTKIQKPLVRRRTTTKPALLQVPETSKLSLPDINNTEKSKKIVAVPEKVKLPDITGMQSSVLETSEKPRVPNTQYNFPRKRKPAKTTPRYSNHKYPDEQASTIKPFSNQGMTIIDAPKLLYKPSTVDTNYWHYMAQNTERKQESPNDSLQKVTTFKPLINDLIPDHLKPLFRDIETSKLEVESPDTKYSSQYIASDANFPEKPHMKENVKDILASIGLFPAPTTTTTVPDIANVAESLSPDMKELLINFGLLPDPKNKSEVITEVPLPNPHAAEVSRDSYIGFKPLPDDSASREDMEAFLASFGLGRNARRSQKSFPPETPEKEPEFNFDMIPELLKPVLSDLGFVDREGRKIRTPEVEKTQGKQHVFNPTDSKYASNDELKKLSELLDVIKQLEKLNGTAGEEDLKHINLEEIKDLVGSLNNMPLDEQEQGPNPLNYDYGLSKNEIKREENASASTTTEKSSNTSSVSSSSTSIYNTTSNLTESAPITSTPSSSSSSVENSSSAALFVDTEESRTPSLADLEDSFGGSSDTASQTSPSVEETTPRRKTGFYFLVDWNTFLDIDNTKGKRVNLRFQPKIGDPTRFYSVTVP